MIADRVLEQYQELQQLLKAGDLALASATCESLVTRHPEFAPGWATASQLALLRRDRARALDCADRAIALERANSRFLTVRAHALWSLADPASALETAATARDGCGPDPAAWQELGGFYVVAERFAEACEAYLRAVALAPGSAELRFNLAATLRIVGRLEESETEYDRVIALRPAEHEAYYNRADLRRQTLSRNHVRELEQLLSAGIRHPRGEVFIRYALAKELEDLERYAESFRHLHAGATLRRRHISYDLARDAATFDWIAEAFPEAPAQASSSRAQGPVPIFVVGMPRTGTTLVERILGRHSAVFAAGELPHFADALVASATAAAGGTALPRKELVQTSATIDFAALGADYLARARLTTGDARCFIDKMPLNFLYLGLIRRALPDARIIHLTRHPLATGYAVYKTLFKDAYPFSYDLGEIASYYAGYRRLMRHWHTVMPDAICDVSYEALVGNLDAEARRLVAFCGLDWQPACVEFQGNPNPSATASAAQVRRPLYSSSLRLWQHYERELEPLRLRLIEAGVPEVELAE